MDAFLSLASVALLWGIILTIDARAGDQMTRYIKASVSDNRSSAVQLRQGVSHVSRSVYEMSYVYGPLMTFSGVAVVLVYMMLRTK